MTLDNNLSKIDLLDGTINLFVSEKFNVIKKRIDTIEITFSENKYPVLGINLECFENPKLNTTAEIENFLSNNLKIDKKITRDNDLFNLTYDVKVDNERLCIWKVLHYLKPRSFRLLRFSLTWPDNVEAEKIVQPILEEIPNIIASAKFNFSRTFYDNLASLKYKLNNAKDESKKFWNMINLNLPKYWVLEYDEDKSYAKIFMSTDKTFHFFIENFNIEIKSNSSNSDKIVEKFIGEITKDVVISKPKLKKSENSNYLFYFLASEKETKNSNKIIHNKIWYRIKVLKDQILIISAVFELSSTIELENNAYLEKIHQIMEGSEILV